MGEFANRNKRQSKTFQKHKFVKDSIKKTLFLKFLLLTVLISTNSKAQRIYKNGILHTDTLSNSGVAAPCLSVIDGQKSKTILEIPQNQILILTKLYAN